MLIRPKQAKRRRPINFGTVPGTKTVLLTAPTKMPGYSWSLPAHKSCPRENGDICGSCYADKGTYKIFPYVKRAQNARFAWTRDCMKSAEGKATWIQVIINAITKTGDKWFRVHDSGDIFNAAYANAWYEVCKALPEVNFWIPTRGWQIPSKSALPILDPLMMGLKKLATLPNVTVRPSALNFGDDAPGVPGLHAGSTAANSNALQCVAHKQDNECKDCRVCWTDKDTPISYNRH